MTKKVWNDPNWCGEFRLGSAFLKSGNWQDDYLGDKLTVGDCAMVLADEIACPDIIATQAIKQAPQLNMPFGWEREFHADKRMLKFLAKSEVINYQGILTMLSSNKYLQSFKIGNKVSVMNMKTGVPEVMAAKMDFKDARKTGDIKTSHLSNAFIKEKGLFPKIQLLQLTQVLIKKQRGQLCLHPSLWNTASKALVRGRPGN